MVEKDNGNFEMPFSWHIYHSAFCEVIFLALQRLPLSIPPSTKSAVVDKPRRLDLNLAIDCYAVNTIRCKRLALLIIFHGTVFNKIGVGLLKNNFVLSNELMI